MRRIDSIHNPEILALRKLKDRKERTDVGLFLAEGDHLAGEALKNGDVVSLLIQEGFEDRYRRHIENAGDEKLCVVSERVLASLCEVKTPQGVLAVCRLPSTPASLGSMLVALDGVQDPGNVGAVMRTMDAAGFTGMLLSEACADPFSLKTLRAGMGAAFRVPAKTCRQLPDELKALQKQGYTVVTSELGGTDFFDRPLLKKPLCLVIGGEGAGVTPEVSALADLRLKLPMRGGAESLNAAVAAGIMIYDLARSFEK